MTDGIEIDFEVIDDEISRLNPKKVILQIPSGMRRNASEISDRISSRYGFDVILSGDSCYGACDVPSIPTGVADAVVQVGHSVMPSISYGLPVLFLQARISIPLELYLEQIVQVTVPPLGLIATSQHLHQINPLREELKKRGIETLVGSGSDRVAAPGHILGCDYSAALSIAPTVSSFLLLGGGRFHAIGAKLATGKPVFIIDPELDGIHELEIDEESLLRRRHAVIQMLIEADSIGVIVSTKIGQMRMRLAEKMVDQIIESGRRGQILLMDEVAPDRLREFGFRAYVSTACPRIALDDSVRYDDVIGTPVELQISMGKIDWSEYRFDDWSFQL